MANIKDYDGAKVFVHSVGGYEYSFNVDSFPVDKHDWLCDVLGRHMDDIYLRGGEKAAELTRKKVREALGL